MYKLLYIDEDQEQIDNFADYIDDNNASGIFNLISNYPLEDKDEMIELIIKINPDVIVSDYLLNENVGHLGYNVGYNGVELVEKFISIRSGFPCFVLTAKDDDAASDINDVNLVYTKSLMTYEISQSKAKLKFFDRLIKQIEHYKTRINNAEKELTELIEKREKQEVSFEEENRIIELDSFLEKSIDARIAIPDEFKDFSNTKRLNTILSKIDLLIKEIDENA